MLGRGKKDLHVSQSVTNIIVTYFRVSVFIFFPLGINTARADVVTKEDFLSDWKELSVKELRTILDEYHSDGKSDSIGIVVEEDGDYLMPQLKLDAAIIVLDTSGSMRVPETGKIDQVVVDRLVVFLLSMPDISHIVLLDTDGNLIVEWDKEKNKVDPPNTRKLILEIARLVINYSINSDSNWDSGIRESIKFAKKFSRDLRTEIFIFGDEYSSDFWFLLRSLKKQSELPSVNVVQAHETMLNLGKQPQFKTAKDFDKFGKYLTKLTGGTFYQFEGPHYSRSWETVVLVNLVRSHPGESWIVHEDATKIERWNETLKREFKTSRNFLFTEDVNAQVDSKGISLEMSSEVLYDGSVSCIVQRDLLDGSESKDYKALLKLNFVDSWGLVDWELTLDHEL